MSEIGKKIALLVAFVLCLSCFGCVPKDTMVYDDPLKPKYDVELDYDKTFFDDFAGGISSEDWLIANHAWGPDNGGVIKENVGYTDDGVLVLTGNGKYYRGNLKGLGDRTDGTKTGASLISNFTVGAGRYEIKMKTLPRLGACSAMWTFAYQNTKESGIENHEIDIELPGDFSFTKVYNTSWRSESLVGGKETYVTTVDPVNDGEWHTFGFDWFTDPSCIVYYIDGVEVAEATAVIPDLLGRLWVGVWFPDAWTGEANFETDNMYVDYVKYIPFKNQPNRKFVPVVGACATKNEYPTRPISSKIPNKISGGDFENDFTSIESANPWKKSKFNSAVGDIETMTTILPRDDANGQNICVKDGGFAFQYIDAVYENYKYDIDFEARATGEGEKVQIMFYPAHDTMISSVDIPVKGLEWAKYSQEVIAPKGTQRIRVRIVSASGETIFVDNISALFAGEISSL